MTTDARVPLMTRLRSDLHDRLIEVGQEEDCSLNSVLNDALEQFLQRRSFENARLDRPDGPDLVEVTGPWGQGHYRLMVDGVRVPHITVAKTQGAATESPEQYHLSLDDRFQISATWGELWRWAWFMAQAMAVSAGYTSHGPDSSKLNRHGLSERLTIEELRAWADRGWSVHEQSGSCGRTLELGLTFRWPAMEDGDQAAYDLRERIISTIGAAGGKDVVTRLTALAPLEIERPGHMAKVGVAEINVVGEEPNQ